MMRPLVAAVAMAALVGGSVPASATTAPPVSRRALPNGLVVLVREDASAGVVAVSLQVRAGSMFERVETAGSTNLLHQLMVRGAAGRSASALAEEVEELGGTLEASGDVEYAEVRVTGLARHVERLLEILADVALRPTLAAAELDRARPIVLARIRSRGDVPAQHAFDALLHDLYDGHPYRWPSVGRVEVVARLGREELVAHHAALYRPDRMVLAVSGGVRAAPVFRTATRLFGSVAAPGPAAAPAAPAPAPRSDRRVLEHPAQQAQILVGFLAPPLSDPDYAAVRVLGTALGGGMAGRLFRELRDRQGLAYSVSVLGTYRTGPSFLAAYMGTAPANAAAAEAGVLRELDRVRREGVTASELARARAYLLGTLAMDRRTNARHAWYLAFFEVIGAGWDFPERYARAVEAVTLDDVRRVAERYLRAPTIVVLLPPGAGPR